MKRHHERDIDLRAVVARAMNHIDMVALHVPANDDVVPNRAEAALPGKNAQHDVTGKVSQFERSLRVSVEIELMLWSNAWQLPRKVIDVGPDASRQGVRKVAGVEADSHALSPGRAVTFRDDSGTRRRPMKTFGTYSNRSLRSSASSQRQMRTA